MQASGMQPSCGSSSARFLSNQDRSDAWPEAATRAAHSGHLAPSWRPPRPVESLQVPSSTELCAHSESYVSEDPVSAANPLRHSALQKLSQERANSRPLVKNVTPEDLRRLVEPTADTEEEDGATSRDAANFLDCCCGPMQAFMGYALVPCNDPGEVAPMVSEPSHSGNQQRRVMRKIKACIMRLLQSIAFQCFTVGCIVANALIIGFETDMPHLKIWNNIELFFLWVFTMEVVFRLIVNGPRSYFCGLGAVDWLWPGATEDKNTPAFKRRQQADAEFSDVVWNIFDFSIVCTGWFMVALESFAAKEARGQQHDATLLRVVRLLRLLRILRVVRVVRFLKQLYLLAYGFLEGASAVFWVAVLAATLIYLCAVVLVRSFHSKSEDDPGYDFFASHFYSVPGAMFTLFELMASPTLGNYREVLCQSPVLAVFIVLFVIFGSFGMNGLLTGVISESIMEKNQARLESQRQEREIKRRWLESSFSQLFDETCGVFKGAQMSLNQFRQMREEVMAVVSVAGVNVVAEDLDSMFVAMDYNDNGVLDKADFIHGILELCEEVRPMSIMEIHCQVSRCSLQIENCCTVVGQLSNAFQQWARREPVQQPPHESETMTFRRHSSGGRSLSSWIGDELGHEDALGSGHVEALAALQRRLAASAGDHGTASLSQLVSLGRALSKLVQENGALVEEALHKCTSVPAGVSSPSFSNRDPVSCAADVSAERAASPS